MLQSATVEEVLKQPAQRASWIIGLGTCHKRRCNPPISLFWGSWGDLSLEIDLAPWRLKILIYVKYIALLL